MSIDLSRSLSKTSTLSKAEPVHIIGVGNVGQLVAHSLAKGSLPPKVTLLFHRQSLASQWDEAGQCIKVITDGLVEEQRGFSTEVLSAQDGVSTSEDVIKYLIVTTKAQFTTAALRLLKHRLTRDSTILFLQNGMGIMDGVTSSLFPDMGTRPQYLTGIISHGVHRVGPFAVNLAGIGTVQVGSVPHLLKRTPQNQVEVSETSRYLLEAILRAPVLNATATTPQGIFRAQLEKLVVNAMINPLTAVLNCRNGELFGRLDVLLWMRLLLAEASSVVRGLAGSADSVAQERFSFSMLEDRVRSVAANTGDNISSMLQDVRAARDTEIDYINGFIVARGAELGIDCIHNRKLVAMVKRRQIISESEISEHFPISTSGDRLVRSMSQDE